MKLINTINNIFHSIKISIKRFPITVLISTIFTGLLITYNELKIANALNNPDDFERVIMVVGLGIPLSLCIGLLRERFFVNDKTKGLIAYLSGLTLMILYYYFLLREINIISISRYLGIMIFLILGFFYIPRLRYEEDYEKYVIKVFSSGFLTAIYAAVLFIGISAILFTIDNLFEANIKGQLYFYMFLIVVFIFGISMFLSKIPNINEEFAEHDYYKSLKVLLLYIVVPLISAYTAILYAYFIKILVTWIWPKGLVSHLVLWYSLVSIGVIFLITPLIEENKTAKAFKIWFPKFILPLLVMMFLSIGQRISQYGITEKRYYIVVLGLWVLGIMLYFSFKKPLKNIIIPITLSIVVLNSIMGPLSSFSVSKYSQNRRFESLLTENNMINNGEIVRNDNISREDKREINNIVTYFIRNHSLEDLKYLPRDFDVANMENLFGFKYEPFIDIERNEEYFYYALNPNQGINIQGYDYYINISSWNNQILSIDDISYEYNRDENILNIYKDGNIILAQDMLELTKTIHERRLMDNQSKVIANMEDMAIDIENSFARVKFIFTNISLRAYRDTDETGLDSVDFILLIDIM